MNEVKFEGISDTQIMQPLFDLLENVSGHLDLRLSQIAQYAKQALRGIHSDVSPWEKLGKSAWNVVKGGAAVAGSVGTLDPSKLLEGLEAVGEVAKMVKLITDIIDGLNNISDVNKDVQTLKGPGQWYVALRYTDLTIQGRKGVILESLLKNLKPSLKKDENFLCGLCALLEQAIHDNSDNEVIKVLRGFLTDQRAISKSRRVREWVNLIVGPAKSTKPSKTKRLLYRLHLSREYFTTVGYQKAPSQTLENVLLEKAWPTCHEAKVFYADQVIRNYYTDEILGRLNVERIGNNERLPMDKCYINLAIVQREAKENKAVEQPSLSFHRRLAIWEPKESDRVSLVDLFQSESDAEQGMFLPSIIPRYHAQPCIIIWIPILLTVRLANKPSYQRILIRGQAGVGKSTLCKKIVYDYIYHNMWLTIINRVIWLPLRQLKGRDMQKYNFKRLLYERYFNDGSQEGVLLADGLYAEIIKEESTTLFILDGLDEVLEDISSGESELLLSLLQKPRAIITTRPYAVDRTLIKNIDREVETIGFYKDQVGQYIKAVAPKIVDEVKAFLSTHPRVEELASIPVQLDAFCYIFERGTFDEGEGPQTMTELYNAIEQMMWKKDVVQLEKNRQGRSGPIYKNVAFRLNPKELKGLVQGEVNALQALAFDGLNNNTEEFDFKYMDKFWEREYVLTEHLAKAEYSMSSKDLEELSLLRTLDGGVAARNRSYHFLHLTFQEYFAAQYFVQHWPDKHLPQLGVSTNEFLRREKYNPRFNIMWRFVTGLLHAKGDARKFFETIETEPYDLLGFVHQRLVMDCLDEVAKLQKTADFELRTNLEDHLKQWLLFTKRMQEKYSSGWAFICEYPEKVLQQCLSKSDDESLQGIILGVLKWRPILSSDTVNQVIKYCESSNRGLQINALGVLSSHKYLPSNRLHTILKLIGNSDASIQYGAISVLSAQSDLPDAIFSELIALVKHGNKKVRSSALETLTSVWTLPERTLLEMVAIVPDLDEDGVREIKEWTFKRRLDLPEEIVLKMLDAIQRSRSEEQSESQWNIVHMHRAAKQSGRIMPKVVEKLLNMLEDPNSNVREIGAYFLCGYGLKDDPDLLYKIMDIVEKPNLSHSAGLLLSVIQGLPENILHKIVDCLENYDTGIQSTATSILGRQAVEFSTAILQRMSSLLNNPRKRQFATEALHDQRCLPEQILQTLLNQFKDPRTRLYDQKLILSNQSALPDSILQQLIALLQVEDAELQCMAKDVFSSIRSTLPEISIRKLTILLDCKNINIQYAAMQALIKQSSLPGEVVRKIVSSIWHYDELKIRDIFKNDMDLELVQRFIMMPELLSDKIRLLKHPNRNVRIGVLHGLERIPDLPGGILEEMVHLLGVADEDLLYGVIQVFLEHLGKSGSLDSVPEEMTHLFDHSNKKIRDAAVSAFAQQPSVLSKQILQNLAPQLKDFQADALHELSPLLGLQPTLPEMMLQDLVAIMLNDPLDTGNAAADILTESLVQSDATFNLLFDLLDEESFTPLFKFWVKESFGMSMTWLVDGKNSIISLRGRDRSIPLDKLKNIVRKARESLGFPYQDFGQVL